MTLRPDEPPAGHWRVESLTWLVELLLRTVKATNGGPPVVTVDGRGASGKSTLAERLRLAVPGAQVVHTDDIAWALSRFGWDDLMIDHHPLNDVVVAPAMRDNSDIGTWTRDESPTAGVQSSQRSNLGSNAYHAARPSSGRAAAGRAVVGRTGGISASPGLFTAQR